MVPPPSQSKATGYGSKGGGCASGSCGTMRSVRGPGPVGPVGQPGFCQRVDQGTGPAAAGDHQSAGVNGVLPAAATVFGGQGIGDDWKIGGRLKLGAWLNQGKTLGFGGTLFMIEGDRESFAAASNAAGTPLLARPFFNSSLFNAQDSLIVTGVGLRRGDIVVTAENNIASAEAFGRFLLYSQCNRRLDLVAGYQYSRIDDSLFISHRMEQIGGLFPVGTRFTFEDLFAVQNTYHAGEIGLWGEYDCRPFTLSMMAKLSLGNMHRVVDIRGTSSRTLPGFPADNYVGGLLALGSNLGHAQRGQILAGPGSRRQADLPHDAAAGPVLGLLAAVLGRRGAGRQSDRHAGRGPNVNSTQLLGGRLVGADHPVLPEIKDTRFWVQGVSAGCIVRF